MNNLETVLKKGIKNESYTYGLSNLHAWIRCMEWILHLSYRFLAKVFKYNEKFTVEEKLDIALRKRKFRENLNMLVDTVKQGAGNTNDGNTARKFFQNYNDVGDIT